MIVSTRVEKSFHPFTFSSFFSPGGNVFHKISLKSQLWTDYIKASKERKSFQFEFFSHTFTSSARLSASINSPPHPHHHPKQQYYNGTLSDIVPRTMRMKFFLADVLLLPLSDGLHYFDNSVTVIRGAKETGEKHKSCF